MMVGKNSLNSVQAVQIEPQQRDLLKRHAEKASHHADYLRRVRKHFLMEFYLGVQLNFIVF